MNSLRKFFLACLLVAVSYAEAGSVNGKVVGVVDGDTVDVLDDSKTHYRIRLAGLDAPERAQPFGQRSKQNLSDLVFGKQVEVDYAKKDRYGRIVGKLLVNGKDINIQHILDGFAWHYKQYEKEQSPTVNRPGFELTPRSWTVAIPPIRRCFSACTPPG